MNDCNVVSDLDVMIKICGDFCNCNPCCPYLDCSRCACVALYNAGYRKIENNKGGENETND